MNCVALRVSVNGRSTIRRLELLAAALVALCSAGCANRVSVRPIFNTYDKVIIDTSKGSVDKALFTSLWMREFPNHSLLDWTLAKAQLNVSAFDTPATVQKARKELGVKGIVNIDADAPSQLSITVVDTESATLSGSVTVKTSPDEKNPQGQRDSLIERAIRMLAAEARRVNNTPGQAR